MFSNVEVSLAQTESQSFASEAAAKAAGWLVNDEGRNPDRGCGDGLCATDLGWKPSNVAGGAAAGEGGGLLHRSGGAPVGFYADTTIGTLNLEKPFSARGKVALRDINFDGHTHLGFFDATRLLKDPTDRGAMIGFQIAEPGGGVAPNFRWGYIVVDDQGQLENTNATFVLGLPDSQSLPFEIEYTPSVGDGQLTLRIGEEDPASYTLTPDQRANGMTLTGFGVFTGPYAGSSARAQSMDIFVDDVTYTSLAQATLAGDFNGDGKLDASDIDALSAEVRKGSNNVKYDVTADNKVNDDDRAKWVVQLRKTYFGDANLDGEFNSTDFVSVFQIGEYEDATAGNSGWSDGDWNGDADFSSGDFVTAFQDGGFEKGPRAAVAAVPEPASMTLLALGLGCLVATRRSRDSHR